jgi:predicted nucleic acid-binding protein
MADIEYQSISDFINSALQGNLTPLFYFDTNILLDIIDQREGPSIELFDFLIQKEWKMVTSVFAKVEIYETKQKDKFRQEKVLQGWTPKKIRNNIEKKRDLTDDMLENILEQVNSKLTDVIKHFNPFTSIAQEGWDIAEDIKKKTNLSDKDSIHLAEARMISCNVFLTKDRFLIKVAKNYIFSTTPREIMNILQKFSQSNGSKGNKC